MQRGLGDTICLVRDASGGEGWREGEESSSSGQFTPKGHHLAALLAPDTFISRIEAIRPKPRPRGARACTCSAGTLKASSEEEEEARKHLPELSSEQARRSRERSPHASAGSAAAHATRAVWAGGGPGAAPHQRDGQLTGRGLFAFTDPGLGWSEYRV